MFSLNIKHNFHVTWQRTFSFSKLGIYFRSSKMCSTNFGTQRLCPSAPRPAFFTHRASCNFFPIAKACTKAHCMTHQQVLHKKKRRAPSLFLAGNSASSSSFHRQIQESTPARSTTVQHRAETSSTLSRASKDQSFSWGSERESPSPQNHGGRLFFRSILDT